MYGFCPDGHQFCDHCCSPLPNNEPPPSYVLPSYAATQPDQEPPSPHSLHEFGGCRGIWIYVCCKHMDSYCLNHHPPHVELHRPPPPAPCISTDKPLVVTDNQKKEPEKFTTDDKPTVRVYCKAKTDFSLTIRDGKVILAPCNVYDPHQHWIKDERFGIDVKDEHGHSSFALINKATGQAMKHSIGAGYPVRLTEYNPDKQLDKSVLWTLGKDCKIRLVDNVTLHLDAEKGIKEFGGVKDGTQIILWDWKINDDDNQKWTIIGYCKFIDTGQL